MVIGVLFINEASALKKKKCTMPLHLHWKKNVQCHYICIEKN